MLHRWVDETAAHNLLNDGNLTVRLDTRRQRPENLRRIVNVDVLVENENVFRPVPGERRGRRSPGVSFRHFFHGNKNIQQRVTPAGADYLNPGNGFAATP